MALYRIITATRAGSYYNLQYINNIIYNNSHRHLLITSKLNLLLHKQDKCNYSNISSGWNNVKYQYTKYRITKPMTSDSTFDDIILREPSRNDFTKDTKEITLFLRFLKLVTDIEKRQISFTNFAKRCENGLIVEKDLYITKKELIDTLWKNGYTETEISAFEIAFPSDYKFHYPELAVLFNLCEEETYKYCLRCRAANPEELVELKYKKQKNIVSIYGLTFLGAWLGLSNTVLSNAWFYAKTVPFGLVFYLLGLHFYRDIREYFWKTERAKIQTAKEKKEIGEDLICKQISKYSNDSHCLEYLKSFKNEVQQQLANYRISVLYQHKEKAAMRMITRLIALQTAEKQMQSTLQHTMIQEIVNSFKQLLTNDQQFKKNALKNAILGLAEDKNSKDVVAEYFKSSLKEIQKVDISKSKSNQHGIFIERLSWIFHEQQKNLLSQFVVKASEAAEIKELLKKCKKDVNSEVFDFSNLQPSEFQRLDDLSFILNNRLGLEPFDESLLSSIPLPVHTELKNDNNYDKIITSANQYVEEINKQLKLSAEKLKYSRLNAFAKDFV